MNNFFLVVFISTFLIGCANVSTLQTAKTLEPGETEFKAGLGYAFGDLNIGTNTAFKYGAPYLETYARSGIVEKLDLGFKATLLGTVSGDAKFKLFDFGEFAIATGLSVGFLSIDTQFLANQSLKSQRLNIWDWVLPLYLSYDFLDNFAVYGAPKVLLRQLSTEKIVFYGSSLGIKVGKTVGLYLEGSYLLGPANQGVSVNIGQVNGSVFF